MKKIFLSLPMKGRKDKDIIVTIERMKAMIKMYYPNEDIEFVHNYNPLLTKELEQFKQTMPDLVKNEAVWYLGTAIKLLAGCDELYTVGESEGYNRYYSKGCLSEIRICDIYDIPVRCLNNINNYLTPDLKAEEEKATCSTGPAPTGKK